MTRLYFMDEPSVISFSGGRTSAYMLNRIIEAHDGQLPDYVKVTFANTGKEMPQTLDFVQACADHWNVDIVWLELGEYERTGVYKTGSKKGKIRYKATTRIVDRQTASMNGEPFELLIKKRRYLPNIVSRFCTSELKVRRIQDYLKTLKFDRWTNCLGIRADEQRRAVKLNGKKESGFENYLPLYLDGVTKQDIGAFWKQQPFDLQLPNNNGTTDFGNCDLCFLKGYKKKVSIIRQRPDLADWWIEQERLVSQLTKSSMSRFRNDMPSYKEMSVIATDNHCLDLDDTDSIGCFCGE